MSSFWEAITAPVPFYTVDNVKDAMRYIGEHPGNYNGANIGVWEWVLSMLTGDRPETPILDVRILTAAAQAAEKEHDKGVLNKDFVAAVRWRYMMTAIRDYIRAATKGG